MSTRHETSVLLTEIEEDYSPRTASARRRAPSWTRAMVDPGDDHARQRLAALTGRPVEFCCACGRPTGDHARQAASGKTYCASCAERTVAAYDARHPEVLAARRRVGAPREWTRTGYLAERERYAVRFHAGNARWQISDTQTRRWTARWHRTEGGAEAIAATMNAAWREQVAFERLGFSARTELRAEGL
jgi:hypothetical protein